METRKLYYEDCNTKAFSALVLDCRETDKGFLVTLDATAFYPEGGGQPCDLGTLEDARVLDVQEQQGRILHLCSKALTPGSRVTGRIDWDRRFDLMQQHAGEHIVSGVIHKLFGCHNVGFHMGAEVITIDFDAPIPTEALGQIESLANQAVFEDLPIVCHVPDGASLAAMTYRTKKALSWPVRIVEIPGYDRCACCGVHVKTTGQIGIIKLLSCVKFHQGVRMEMVCGKRALNLLSAVYEQNRQVSQAFSAKLLQTGEAARNINEALTAEKFRCGALQRQLFDRIADSYVNCGNVLHFAPGLEPASVRELADRIAGRCGGTAAVFSGSDGGGYHVCLVNKSGDVNALGQAMNAALEGRGGGKAGFFQGSVNATDTGIADFFRQLNF